MQLFPLWPDKLEAQDFKHLVVLDFNFKVNQTLECCGMSTVLYVSAGFTIMLHNLSAMTPLQ